MITSRDHAAGIVLAAHRDRLATALRLTDARRRRATVQRIVTAILCHPWPAALAADATALARDAEARIDDRREPISTLRIVNGQPVLAEV